MIFTSTPENGSSWHNSLRFGLDTEQSDPTDLTLEIATQSQSIAQRKLYGVTTAEVDIAPYLREFSYLPPIIGDNASITTSRSAQRVQLIANGVASRYVSLFHAPFKYPTPHIISRGLSKRTITLDEPIILTAFTMQNLVLSVMFTTPTKTSTIRLNAKTTGLPVDITIPTSAYTEDLKRINISINSDKQEIANMEFNVVENHKKGWCIAWFNKDGGMETYTFPIGIRQSYDATIQADKDVSLEQYAHLQSTTINYRLCSAYELPEQIERLTEIIFSPRIFIIKDGEFIPISLKKRHVEFDNHGSLRQMCIEIEQRLEGGAL